MPMYVYQRMYTHAHVRVLKGMTGNESSTSHAACHPTLENTRQGTSSSASKEAVFVSTSGCRNQI